MGRAEGQGGLAQTRWGRMAEAQYQYSLVLATLDDRGLLEGCLSSLAAMLPGPSFEVIVVDQNRHDGLRAMIAGFSGCLAIVHERVSFVGVSRARNHGAALARGGFLAFPDDDCRFLPDTLHQVDLLTADQDVRVITGQTIDEAGEPSVRRWVQEARTFTRATMFGCLTEAAMFVRRDLFAAAGGFDERFGLGGRYPSAEGLELMGRLFDLIGPDQACFCPRVRVVHPAGAPPWNRAAVGRFYAYARGEGALMATNPWFHLRHWGGATTLAAVARMLSCRGWFSAAQGARVLGILAGFGRYHLDTWRS